MDRRKFVIGAGSLAAGGAAAMGTGAFSSVEADRPFEITVADDDVAYLTLTPNDNHPNGNYAKGNNNVFRLDFDGNNQVDGGGVNGEAVSDFKSVFQIKNQGTQEVGIYVELGSDANNDVTSPALESPDKIGVDVYEMSSGDSIVGQANSKDLGQGDQWTLGITINTDGFKNGAFGPDSELDAGITFNADASLTN
ncbi:hypothetical protein [Halorubrum tropicale]|uniref:hypothetical protein n=1 Tax=Halorubrum tropicale TaxID=1765655 RepID=UPI001112B448|nr:hypothetical protein [Halorubrum tropicale]